MHGLLDSTAQVHKTWQQRTHTAAQLLRNDCLNLEHVNEVNCSIVGGPQNLSLVLDCSVEDQPQKTGIIEYVEYVLLEALEHYLGVRIEQRKIRFTTPSENAQQVKATPPLLAATA